MAARGGDSSNRNYGFSSSVNQRKDSDDDYPPRSSSYHKQRKSNSYEQQDLTDLNEMTLEVVNDFKRSIQNRIQTGGRISEPIVELDVANIRRNKYSDQCNFDQWKRNLSRDVQNCPDSILRVSMAYGNDPQEVKPILQTKMNNLNSNVNPTDTSLHNLIEPLKKLKRELDNSQQPNLFHTIQNIDDRRINHANRLFLSEAHHFAPGLKDYTFTDAQNAVEAIRQANYESDDRQILIPIIKTFRDVDEIGDYLKSLSISSSKHNDSPKKSSKFPDDEPHTTSNSTTNNRTRNNNDPTSNFYCKPFPEFNQNSPQLLGRSSEPANPSRDESSPGLSRRNSERK